MKPMHLGFALLSVVLFSFVQDSVSITWQICNLLGDADVWVDWTRLDTGAVVQPRFEVARRTCAAVTTTCGDTNAATGRQNQFKWYTGCGADATVVGPDAHTYDPCQYGAIQIARFDGVVKIQGCDNNPAPPVAPDVVVNDGGCIGSGGLPTPATDSKSLPTCPAPSFVTVRSNRAHARVKRARRTRARTVRRDE